MRSWCLVKTTAGPGAPGDVGLPPVIAVCLFDLDGVLTPTAAIHAAAWKEMFDRFLEERAAGGAFEAFDPIRDYDEHVDGRPRYDGVRAFLDSRGIRLPEGDPADPPGAVTVCGLGNRKNDLVVRLISERGVTAYPGSRRYLEAVRRGGRRCAVVSSSANCREVLRSASLEKYFDVVVDGVVAANEHLAGKPAPDTFLAAAGRLGTAPAAAAVFEDALAGVAAGRAGGFGHVVGVNRTGQADELRRRGADVVVADLADLLAPG